MIKTEIRAHQIRIEPSDEQIVLLNKTSGCCRLSYNYMLQLEKELYENDKENHKFNIKTLKNRWNAEKKEMFDFIEDVISQHAIIDKSVDGLRNGFSRFFKKKSEYPTFKCKNKDKDSFCLWNKEVKIDLGSNRILLSKKFGWVRMSEKPRFDINSLVGNITFSREGNHWFVTLLFQVEIDRTESQGFIGIDLGIENMAIASDGTVFENLRITKRLEKKLRRLNKELSRRKKGGSNWWKTVYKLRKVHKEIKDLRSDYTHKLTNYLSRYEVVFIEDLNVKGMVRNRKMSKHLYDVNFGEIRRQLEYKCVKVIAVPRFYPSSQLCNNCEYRNKKVKNLRIREWTCPKCGAVHNRDINAAKNILKKGLEILNENSSASQVVNQKRDYSLTESPIKDEVRYCVVNDIKGNV